MNTTTSPAPLGLRLLALLYDLLPLLGLWFVCGVLALAVSAGALDPHRLGHKIIVQVLVLVVTSGYFVISWSRGGQTIGMRAWKLRLVTDHGTRLPWPRALLRFFLATVSLLFLGAGFWWSLFDPERRTLHDKLLDCRMQRTIS